jgi:hypothetical protein
MKTRKTIKTRRSEVGIALLISIFVLLLISVVAIALIVSSGTESALAGNYRSSTGVYYAAVSGLEEARGRLLAKNPSSFKTTAGSFLPAPGTTLPIGSVAYVLNPGPTEAMGNILTTYPDTEYDNEFGLGTLAAVVAAGNRKTTPSVWNRSPLNSLNVPGPLYKWVRINAISEKSLNLDVGPSYDGFKDPITPVFYDGAQLNVSNTGAQVLEITSLAVLPNGSQKIVQYLVTSVPITLPPFLAALTLSGSTGNNPVFQAPHDNNSYAVKGDGDQDCSGNPLPSKVAIGIFGDYSGGGSGAAVTGVVGGIPPPSSSVPRTNYTGQATAPDVEYLTTYPTSMQTPTQLDAIMQTIAQNADVTIPSSGAINYPLPTFTESSLTSLGMSSSNLQTIVVNGNLDVTGWTGTGYGLLLVLGKFTYDPATTWNGIVLVVGQGIINNIDHGEYMQMNGAVFVAKTRDSSGNLLPEPKVGKGNVSFDDDMEGNGIRYSSCWIQKAQPGGSYKILSFHEISQ